MLDLHASAWVALDLDWSNFLTRVVSLPALPADFPLPSAEPVRIEIELTERGDHILRAATDFELDRDIMLGGLALGRQFRFELAATLSVGALTDLLSGSPPQLSGEIKLGAALRLPALPAAGPLQLHLGDAEGWLHVTLDVNVNTEGALSLRAQFGAGEFGLDICLPGATTGVPLLQATLHDIEISVAAGSALHGAPSAILRLEGAVVLNPVAPPDDIPFAYQWQQLFAAVAEPVDLQCSLALTISTGAFRADLSLRGAEIELRPFAAIAGLAANTVQVERELPLELPLHFSLHRLQVCIASELAQSEFKLNARLVIGEIEFEAWIAVSGSAFVIGVGHLRIPLTLPRFPMTQVEFDALYGHPDVLEQRFAAATCPPADQRDSDPRRAAACKRLRAQRFLLHSYDAIPAAAESAGHPLDSDALSRYRAWLRLFVGSLDLATSIAGNGESESFRITERVCERLRAEDVPDSVVKRLASIKSRISGAQRFATKLKQCLGKSYDRYGALVTEYAGIHGASLIAEIDRNEHVIIEDATLVIDHLELRVPFSSPNNVRADGGIKFTAYSEPLGDIDVDLEVGISADMIYFSLKSADGRVSIPPVGRYTGGSLRFGQFLIGFGYTRRSLALAIAGELVLPEQLVRDLDTTDVTIFGVQLPVRTQIAFRLDLIPIPSPEVAIIIPLLQFNLDLRRGPPALRDQARCIPEWDGLQLRVGDQLRLALTHVAFAPMFGFLPSLNWVLSGNLVCGDEHNGLAVVIDECMQIDAFFTGTAIKGVLPGFCDDTPFINDGCIELRVAGFGVHFHLQRPFPSLSPLALPELFALVADPANYPVNPRGELANCMRVTLLNTGIRLPENLLALFPALRTAALPPVSETLNLGSFISASQKIVSLISPLLQELITRIKAAANDPQALVEGWKLPRLSPRDLLRLLPAELQRLDTQASLAGFCGRAVVVLLTMTEARAALRARDQGGAPAPLSGIMPGDKFTAAGLLNFQPRLSGHDAAPPPTTAALLADPLFAAFNEDDLRATPITHSGDGVLVSAQLHVIGGQRFDFIGYVAADGRFALVAALNQAPLELRVAGIDIPLPLSMSGQGRLTLQGQADRSGVRGAMSAKGNAQWKILPGMIEACVDQASLTLASDGMFALHGDLRLALFDGRMTITGQIDVAPTHAILSGRLALDQGPLRLDLRGTGALGPLHRTGGGRAYEGARMDITAVGNGRLFEQPLSAIKARLTGERLELQGEWRAESWALFATSAVLKARLALHGVMWFAKAGPMLRLDGRGEVAIRWNQAMETPADLRIEGAGRFECSPGSSAVDLSGTLHWQGRSWAGGTLRTSSAGVSLGGHTTFTQELPPRGVALLPNLPRLVLRLDIHGQFELDTHGLLSTCEFDAHWLLGARLDDSSDQLLPLAAGGRKIEGTAEVELLSIANLQKLPGGMTLPVPLLQQETGGFAVKVGKIGDEPAVRICDSPTTGKTIKLRKADLTIGGSGFQDFFGNVTDLTINGPAVPDLSDDDIYDEVRYLYPLTASSQTVALSWGYASGHKLSLCFSDGVFAVRLVAEGNSCSFTLGDGVRFS
jgi:hypothetical protein